jgi:hypothetical protein
MGQVAAPLGISGEGSLTWSDGGLRLTGALQSKNAGSVFGCLGFIIGFFGVIALMMALDIKAQGLALLGVAGAPIGVKVGRWLFPAKPIELNVRWADVATLRLDSRELEGREVVSFKVKGGFFSFAPKGAVYFQPAAGTPAELMNLIRPFAERNGVQVEKPVAQR